MKYKCFKYSLEDHIAHVTLIRGDELNTMIKEFWSELPNLIDEISNEGKARAIQGACVGGGVDMISACDIRYATSDAFFCIQETNLGLVADVGTLQRLPKLIPEGIVRDLALTGRKMMADEAERYGLISAIFDDHESMLDHAMDKAREIASKSPLAISGIKEIINYSRDHSVDESKKKGKYFDN